MSILTIIQQAAGEAGLTPPASVVNSSDTMVKQMLAICKRVGADLRNECQWPQLTRDCLISLVAGQENYELPNDFEYAANSTNWNRSMTWPMYGPISPQEWQLLKSGIAAQGVLQKFRVKGYSSKQFYITPTPTSTDDAASIVFEYQSKNWVRPKIWESSAVFPPKSYTFYDGYYFYSASGGTSGANAPTPTSLNDGGIVWTLFTGVYDDWKADSDECHFDELLVALGVAWNHLAAKNLPYAHLREKFETDKTEMCVQIKGAQMLSMTPQPRGLVGDIYTNLPNTGYGLP